MTTTMDLSQSIEGKARKAAEVLRSRLAQLAGCKPDEIAFLQSEGTAPIVGLDVLAGEIPAKPFQIRLVEQDLFIQVGQPEQDGAFQPSLSQSQSFIEKLTPAALTELAQTVTAYSDLLQGIADHLSRTYDLASDIVPSGLVLKADTETRDGLSRLGLKAEETGQEMMLHIPDMKTAKDVARYLGATSTSRKAIIRRTTKETDITVAVNLDGDGASVSTGVHFFNHMLEQIARHGGIGLDVTCVGDVEVDAHHTIEDVCLALGDGLREALGDKRGIGRYGFALPMDETRASCWIDLSGRPYFRFDGEIPGERVGDYPVEMAAHAFRSISETLKASIHVEVDGENAHHMIEASFKAFARALRQAVRIDGDDLPSTKGVL